MVCLRIVTVGLVFMMVGCGGVRETVTPSGTPRVSFIPTLPLVRIEGVRKVALFPFADYSHQQNHLQAELWGGNIKVLEEITDHLVAHGIAVAVQEDVNTLLVDHNIIKPIPHQQLLYGSGGDDKNKYRTKVIGTPEYDLVNVEHSEDMKDEIIRIIRDEVALEKAEKPPIQTPLFQGATVGLSREMIKQLGETLGVDLIIRGRIIEYGFKDVDTYNPLKRGFLPVFIEPVKDVLFGATEACKYESGLEDVDYSRLGEGLGFLVGQKTEDAVEGTWDVLIEHSFGSLANLHPRKKSVSSIVQIRMYAQDVKTGEVVWSNRAETEYVPLTGVSFNQRHPKNMFDESVKRCVSLLMNDLFGAMFPASAEVKGLEEKGTVVDRKLTDNEQLINELKDKIGQLEQSKKILLQQIEDSTLITLPEVILFNSGSTNLTAEGKRSLNVISDVLTRYPKRSICVEGHTDNVPIGPKIKEKFPSNWELSVARAIAVMNHMVQNFTLDPSRISVRGYGPYQPVASNETAEGRAQNRRVVIVVGPEV